MNGFATSTPAPSHSKFVNTTAFQTKLIVKTKTQFQQWTIAGFILLALVVFCVGTSLRDTSKSAERPTTTHVSSADSKEDSNGVSNRLLTIPMSMRPDKPGTVTQVETEQPKIEAHPQEPSIWASEEIPTAEIAFLEQPKEANEKVVTVQGTTGPPLKPVDLHALRNRDQEDSSPFKSKLPAETENDNDIQVILPSETDKVADDEADFAPIVLSEPQESATPESNDFVLSQHDESPPRPNLAMSEPVTTDATNGQANDFVINTPLSNDSDLGPTGITQDDDFVSDFFPPTNSTNIAPDVPTTDIGSAEQSASPSKVPARLASTRKKAPPNNDFNPTSNSNSTSDQLGSPTSPGTSNFKLAEQPQVGERWKDDTPQTDQRAHLIPTISEDFMPDPIDQYMPYDPIQQMDVYEGKTLNATQRPLLELGRPWYQLGQLDINKNWLGRHNPVTPQFLVYGDVRTALASNTQNGDNVSQLAFEVNLDFDLKLTSTERFHMFMAPVDDGNNTRYLFDDDEWVAEFDADIDFGYFEGDLGAIVGGFTNETLPFDLPFAVGIMPLLLQNGIWMEDAFLGIAATIPARNSARLDISNMDITFFAGYDKIDSDAFAQDDSAARMYGFASFLEALNGYIEIDYAFFDDRTIDNRSYHNIGIGYSRRIGRLLSNSTRVIVNAGQQTDVVENTADGVLLLSENSLITSSPSTLVPYMNFFVGFDRPQSAARALAAGGILRNTGILFESDGMTNYPTLDPTANDTYGGAFGINLIADDFSQQLVLELAALGTMNEDATRNAPGPQYGLGFRYQLPLSNAVILRMDGMYGFLEDTDDVRGLRMELRRKY